MIPGTSSAHWGKAEEGKKRRAEEFNRLVPSSNWGPGLPTAASTPRVAVLGFTLLFGGHPRQGAVQGWQLRLLHPRGCQLRPLHPGNGRHLGPVLQEPRRQPLRGCHRQRFGELRPPFKGNDTRAPCAQTTGPLPSPGAETSGSGHPGRARPAPAFPAAV